MDERQEPQLGITPVTRKPYYDRPSPSNPPNYAAWALAIAAGVFVAMMAVRQYEIHEAKQILGQIAKSNEQQMRAITAESTAQMQQIRMQQEAQKTIEEERRASDATGSKLSRQCAEWTRTAEQMKSEYAKQEKNRFCQEYQAYVVHSTFPKQ